MKNKKGQAWLAVIIAVALVVAVIMFGTYLYMQSKTPQQAVPSGTTEQIVQQVSQASKEGDVSSVGIYVRDIGGDNINTKIAVATYCQDDKGKFALDGTSSSASAEITAKTEIGRTLTCWAFDSTHQSNPKTIYVDGESPHMTIDAYNVSTTGHIQVYDDVYTTGSNGKVNVSVGAGGTSTFQKMRITNNNTNKILPLGGVYFDKGVNSNVSKVDITGSASLSGMNHDSTQIVENTGGTKVSSRTNLWDYAFEVDDNPSEAGNQPLIMEENDYLESGSVSVTADGDGCSAGADLVAQYAFTKGFYRSAMTDAVKFGYETDAVSPAVITADLIGDTWGCGA